MYCAPSPASLVRRTGLTLIEVLVVIVVIAVLAAIAIPRVMPSKRGAKEAALKADLQKLRTAVALFQAHTGAYPQVLPDVVSPVPPATGLDEQGSAVSIPPEAYQGPYLVAPGGGLVCDPITGAADWVYLTTPPDVGRVQSGAVGATLEQVPYSDL